MNLLAQESMGGRMLLYFSMALLVIFEYTPTNPCNPATLQQLP